MQAQVKAFFDPATWTVSYVVFDAPGGHCALVDRCWTTTPSPAAPARIQPIS